MRLLTIVLVTCLVFFVGSAFAEELVSSQSEHTLQSFFEELACSHDAGLSMPLALGAPASFVDLAWASLKDDGRRECHERSVTLIGLKGGAKDIGRLQTFLQRTLLAASVGMDIRRLGPVFYAQRAIGLISGRIREKGQSGEGATFLMECSHPNFWSANPAARKFGWAIEQRLASGCIVALAYARVDGVHRHFKALQSDPTLSEWSLRAVATASERALELAQYPSLREYLVAISERGDRMLP